jgi:hypothetical protein
MIYIIFLYIETKLTSINMSNSISNLSTTETKLLKQKD